MPDLCFPTWRCAARPAARLRGTPLRVGEVEAQRARPRCRAKDSYCELDHAASADVQRAAARGAIRTEAHQCRCADLDGIGRIERITSGDCRDAWADPEGDSWKVLFEMLVEADGEIHTPRDVRREHAGSISVQIGSKPETIWFPDELDRDVCRPFDCLDPGLHQSSREIARGRGRSRPIHTAEGERHRRTGNDEHERRREYQLDEREAAAAHSGLAGVTVSRLFSLRKLFSPIPLTFMISSTFL